MTEHDDSLKNIFDAEIDQARRERAQKDNDDAVRRRELEQQEARQVADDAKRKERQRAMAARMRTLAQETAKYLTENRLAPDLVFRFKFVDKPARLWSAPVIHDLALGAWIISATAGGVTYSSHEEVVNSRSNDYKTVSYRTVRPAKLLVFDADGYVANVWVHPPRAYEDLAEGSAIPFKDRELGGNYSLGQVTERDVRSEIPLSLATLASWISSGYPKSGSLSPRPRLLNPPHLRLPEKFNPIKRDELEEISVDDWFAQLKECVRRVGSSPPPL